MRVTDTHVYFWSGIYSQWEPARFVGNLHGDVRMFSCAEQYMMAKKAEMFGDFGIMELIMTTDNPKQQKALGRQVANFDVDVWEKHALDIVTVGSTLKFIQNPKLLKKMQSHGDRILVEGSPVDTIWGVGLHFTDPLIEDSRNWKGKNLLGEALMKAREIIKEGL